MNLLFVFCTGALDRIYADCRLGLLVCCFVVHVQNDKLTKLDRERGVGVVGGYYTDMKHLVYGDRQRSHKVNSTVC